MFVDRPTLMFRDRGSADVYLAGRGFKPDGPGRDAWSVRWADGDGSAAISADGGDFVAVNFEVRYRWPVPKGAAA